MVNRIGIVKKIICFLKKHRWAYGNRFLTISNDSHGHNGHYALKKRKCSRCGKYLEEKLLTNGE